jgi:hypothetical protein
MKRHDERVGTFEAGADMRIARRDRPHALISVTPPG